MVPWRKGSQQVKHEDRNSDEENTKHVEHRSWRSTRRKANVHSKLDYANRIVIPRIDYEEEQEQDEEESGTDTFEA